MSAEIYAFPVRPLPVTIDDGGRRAAGFSGRAGDCVTRSIAIATGLSYRTIYDDLAQGQGEYEQRLAARGKLTRAPRRSARNGIARKVYHPYILDLGWEWVPTMGIGTGCTVHLRAGELPAGRLIVSVSKHMTAVVDGEIRDTHDPSRGGDRCVYGYYHPGKHGHYEREWS